jgi:TetR/AcrR family transcriptional repressor of nem operon
VPRPRRQDGVDTAERILDVAERLVQVHGFNGFSYADIAAELKITTASLHYHFASKQDLGQALIERYTVRFSAALQRIEAETSDALVRLRAYADLYAGVLRERRLCLCGMLAAEFQTLADPVRDSVLHFFDENEVWLARVLTEGREDGTLAFACPPEEAARMVVAGLEGAMLIARPYGDVRRFEGAATLLLAGLASRRPD